MLAFLIFLTFLLLYMILSVYAEMNVSAFIQDPLGPRVMSPYWCGQTGADMVKLFR